MESPSPDFTNSLIALSESIGDASSDQGNLAGVNRLGTFMVDMHDSNVLVRCHTASGYSFTAVVPDMKIRVEASYNLIVCTDEDTVHLIQLNNGTLLFKDSFFTHNNSAATWSENKMKIKDATATSEHIVLIFDTGQIGIIHWKAEFLVQTDIQTTRQLIDSDRKVKNVSIDKKTPLIAWFSANVPLILYLKDISTAQLVAPIHDTVLPWYGCLNPLVEYAAANLENTHMVHSEIEHDYGIVGVIGSNTNVIVACKTKAYIINTDVKTVRVIKRAAVAMDINTHVSLLTTDGKFEVWTLTGHIIASITTDMPTFRWRHDAVAEQKFKSAAVVNGKLYEINFF